MWNLQAALLLIRRRRASIAIRFRGFEYYYYGIHEQVIIIALDRGARWFERNRINNSATTPRYRISYFQQLYRKHVIKPPLHCLLFVDIHLTPYLAVV